MKLEQPEAIKDVRRFIMAAYQATSDETVRAALRRALGALGRAVTPPDPESSESSLTDMQMKLKTYL